MSSQVREGLESFCEMWGVMAPVISGSERAIAPALFFKRINCRVRGGESYVLAITPDRATIEDGGDRWAHADIELDDRDWMLSLIGDCNLRSISMAGRFASDMEQLKVVSVFGIIMQSFALLKQG
jgi:hypothetical protein